LKTITIIVPSDLARCCLVTSGRRDVHHPPSRPHRRPQPARSPRLPVSTAATPVRATAALMYARCCSTDRRRHNSRRTRGHELRPFFFFAPSRVYLFGAQRRSGVHLCGGGPAAAGSIPRRMCRGDRRHAAVRGLSSPAAGENDRPAATPVHPGAGAPAGRARVSSHGTIAGTAPTINAALHSLGLARHKTTRISTRHTHECSIQTQKENIPQERKYWPFE